MTYPSNNNRGARNLVEGAEYVCAFATAAVRTAENGSDFVQAVKQKGEEHKANPKAHPLATQEQAGFMSAEDKTRLDNINSVGALEAVIPDPTDVFNTVLGG